MQDFTDNTVPEVMVQTATPSEVTVQEVKDFLNGKAFMFTEKEIANILALPLSAEDMCLTVKSQLHLKGKKLPLVLRLATLQECGLIKKGHKSTGHIINSYTDPESVTLADIPEHDVNVWSHGQTALLAIYKDLLNKLEATKNGDGSLIEKAIRAIRRGQFSDKCQDYTDNFITKGKFSTNTKIKCNKIIPLEAFMKNPLIRKCGRCYE